VIRFRSEWEKICREPIHTNQAEDFNNAILAASPAALLESAQTFGTPQYILDLDRLKARALFFSQTLRQDLPNSDFFYAFKCNDLPLLVKTLKETGFQADVAGIFELQLALKLGFQRIVFNGPGKSKEELNCALKEKNRVIINIDNLEELALLEKLAARKKVGQKQQVGFRLNNQLTPLSGKEWWKFGFQLDQLKEAVRRVRESTNLEWAGLHFHTSWNKTPWKYLENIKIIGAFLGKNFPAAQLRKLEFFDIGGGFYPEDQANLHKGEDKGLLLDTLADRCGNREEIYKSCDFDPYAFAITPVEPLETFAEEIARGLRESILPFNPGMSIFFEPGRFIVTSSTSILLQVTAVKQDCVIVDGGINILGDYKFSEYAFAPVINLTRPSPRLRRQVIFGPLCDPGDLWGYSFYGEELRQGDVLAVLHQGAYTFSTAWRFIKPIPPYIAFTGKEPEFIIARTREKFKDRYAGCRI
jgi:diaminopimelate decarboxylase